MAISLRFVGTWGTSTSTTYTRTLPAHQAGDLILVRAIRKPYTSPTAMVITTPGWNVVGTQYNNGTTSNGSGVGSMAVATFWKVATSSSETSPVITWGATAAPGAAVALVYQKDAAEEWQAPTGVGGIDSTAATSVNDTLGTHIAVSSGDLVDVWMGWCDDSGTPSAASISQPGVTYSVTSDIPATALDTSTSNDLAADGGYALATSGTSSGAATITASFGASEQHVVWMTRLRVTTVVIEALAGTSAASSTASGTLATAVTLAGTSAASSTTSGAMSATVPLSGATAASLTTSGALAAAVPLSGVSAATTDAAADLGVILPLAGATAATSLASASIVRARGLAAAVAAESNASAELEATVPLAGVSGATSASSASLVASVALSASLSAMTTAGATIGRLVPVAGTSAAATTTSGALVASVALSGATGATSGATAGFASDDDIAGTSAATSTVTGSLSASVPLTAAVSTSSAAVATASRQRTLTALAVAQAAASGWLSADVPLAATTDAAATIAAMLVCDRALTGQAVALAWLAATLRAGYGPFSQPSLGGVGALGPSLAPTSLGPGGTVPQTRPTIGIANGYPAITPADTGPSGG